MVDGVLTSRESTGPSVGLACGGAEAERSCKDKCGISASMTPFSPSTGEIPSPDDAELIDRGRDPLLSLLPSALSFGLSPSLALAAMARAAASAAQSVLSRVGDVPATLTRSVETTAGALATDVNDEDRPTRLFRFCSGPGDGIATAFPGDRKRSFRRSLGFNL